MASLFDTLSTILILTWGVGFFVLLLRGYMATTAYQKRLPPINGVPFDTLMQQYALNDFLGNKRRALRRQIYRQQQADPELERLRQAVLRHTRYTLLWMFGFPVVMIGVLVLVVVTGHAR